MPTFATTTVAQVAPKTQVNPNKGVRKAAFEAVKGQVATLVDTDVNDPNRAGIVITLAEGDKALTIRQQILRAAAQLGITMYVRRSGQDIVAYKTGTAAPEATEAANATKKRGPKGGKGANKKNS